VNRSGASGDDCPGSSRHRSSRFQTCSHPTRQPRISRRRNHRTSWRRDNRPRDVSRFNRTLAAREGLHRDWQFVRRLVADAASCSRSRPHRFRRRRKPPDQSRNIRVLALAINQVLRTNAGNRPLASRSCKKTAMVFRNQGTRSKLHRKPQSTTDRRYSLNRSRRPSPLS
jgi:hypothetical protein